ncbi:MAG: glycosyltransferase, partial [Gammaproteobacteria bacterium]|nr:glycosyltransferase [Gammaproteobacteria bacterium]
MANRKALHIINGEHYSGGERIQDILGMTLPQYGYDVGFVCLKPDMFPNVYRSKASPVYSVPMKHKADFMLYKKVAEIIKTEGYDIVHSHMPRSIPVARLASLSAKVPMVHHLHSPTLFEGPSLLNNIVSGILERVSLIGADAVIPCSEGLGKYAKQIGIGSRRVKVVLNGIPGLGLNAEKKAPNDEWVIGVVALFRPRKGFEYLLEAMSLLKARGYSFKLHAIGGFFSQEYRDHID